MSLIDCADCTKQFSDEAISCPNCGRPNTPRSKIEQSASKGARSKWYGIGCAAFLLLGIMSVLGNPGTHREEATPIPERSIEENLAIVDNGAKANGRLDLAAVYRHPLDTLAIYCKESREHIADIAAQAQEIIKQKTGRNISTLDLLHGMVTVVRNSPRPTIPCSQIIAAMMVQIINERPSTE